jgi:death-on-curing protein
LIYLVVEDLLHIAHRIMPAVELRDVGLLEAAVARPRASAFGEDAYLSLDDKAAALVHSIVGNHALLDGNKRLGLAAVIAFYGMNGFRLTLTNEEAFDLVMAVAAGEVDDVQALAVRLAATTQRR